MAMVAAGGPIANVVVAIVAAAVHRALEIGGIGGFALELASWIVLYNLLLAIFNLLPIPPLDGSALLERLLPREWLPTWYRFRPYGVLVLLVLLLWTGIVGTILTPFFDGLVDFIGL
jgi:Zn-dependent protease